MQLHRAIPTDFVEPPSAPQRAARQVDWNDSSRDGVTELHTAAVDHPSRDAEADERAEAQHRPERLRDTLALVWDALSWPIAEGVYWSLAIAAVVFIFKSAQLWSAWQ